MNDKIEILIQLLKEAGVTGQNLRQADIKLTDYADMPADMALESIKYDLDAFYADLSETSLEEICYGS